MKRIIVLAGAPFVGAIVVACGRLAGEDVPGMLDGSVFTLPDGGVLFSPGSGCASFNADAFVTVEDGGKWTRSSAGCALDAGWRFDNPDCVAWAKTIGLAYPLVTKCTECLDPSQGPGCPTNTNPNRCVAIFDPRQPGGEAARCELGAAGDVYCSAFYQQYVLGDRKAVASCETLCFPTADCECFGGWIQAGTGWGGDPNAHTCPHESNYVSTCVPHWDDVAPVVTVEQHDGLLQEFFCAAP